MSFRVKKTFLCKSDCINNNPIGYIFTSVYNDANAAYRWAHTYNTEKGGVNSGCLCKVEVIET